MSGYEVDDVTPKRVPKSRDISSPTVAKKLEPVSMETDLLQKVDTPKATPAKQKPTMRKHASKRVTRSQTVARGNLEDILHAIDIEETPIVQDKYIDEEGRKL